MIDYILTRSKRKTAAIYVRDGSIEVRAPLKMPKRDIESFIIKHLCWIEKQTLIIQEQNANRANNSLSDEQIDELRQRAKIVLPQKVEYYSVIMGVMPKGVKITSAATRWGSCSAKNSLCFSYRLMLLPDDLIDYIVVHELAHIKEKNHSAAFYAVVLSYMPDYKTKRAALKAIQRDLPR